MTEIEQEYVLNVYNDIAEHFSDSVFSCIMVFFLCISGIIIYTDVSKTVVDAQDTLQDLNIILPEVDKTMHMLQHLCNTPEFQRYCGTEQTYFPTITN